MKIFKLIMSLFILAAIVFTGCSLEEPSTVKSETDLQGKDFSKYVSIGNSLTAGYQSGSLVEDHQKYSYPNLIAGQIGISGFEQPIVTYPGIPAILELRDLEGGLEEADGEGVPTNIGLARPYDNLGVPGSVLADMDSALSAAESYSGTQMFDLVLRNPDLGNTTVLDQAASLQPNFITCWIGNNDVLGFATSGGFSPASPTDENTFAALYGALATKLAAISSQVAVANIPDVTSIPFFTTVGPRIAASLEALSVPGIVYQKHGELLRAGTGSASTDDLKNQSILITLLGGRYADLIGTPTGKPWRDIADLSGFPLSFIMLGKDSTKIFGIDPTNPFPDLFVLDADEIQTAKDASTAYNAAILDAANANGFAFFDANSFMADIAANGYNDAGANQTTDFITGGLFSLDGVHPSNLGYGIIANQFIKAANDKFGTAIADVDLGKLKGNAPMGKSNMENKYPDIKRLSSVVELFGGSFNR